MVSLITICDDRPFMFFENSPSWLSQKGITYEIICYNSKNRSIREKADPSIRFVDSNGAWNISLAYNTCLRATKYDNILITNCDMKLMSDHVIAAMYGFYNSSAMVTAYCFDKKGAMNPLLPFCMMIPKKALLDIGGWDEEMGKGYAFEDEDLMARLCGYGLKYVRCPVQAIHVPHEKPEWGNVKQLWQNNYDRYLLKNKLRLTELAQFTI